MEQKYSIIYIIVSLVFFIGGLVCFGYSVNRLYTIYVLNKSDELENAIIVEKIDSVRSFENSIRFSLLSDVNSKTYRVNLIKISSRNLNVNQKVNIIFNKKRNFCIIKEYTNAFYNTYILGILISIMLIWISKSFYKFRNKYNG